MKNVVKNLYSESGTTLILRTACVKLESRKSYEK